MTAARLNARATDADRFSSSAIRNADPDPVSTSKRKTELNDLALQVAAQFSADAISPHLTVELVRLGEFVGLFAISMAICLLYVSPDAVALAQYGGAAFFGTTLAVLIVQTMAGYQVTVLRSFLRQTAKAIAGFGIAILALIAIGFFTKLSGQYSRVWLGGWLLAGTLFLLVYRSAVAFYVRRAMIHGRLERRAVIVGGGQPAAELIRSLETQNDSDIRICGIFDDRDDKRSPLIVAGYPKLGTVSELVEFARMARVDMLIVSLPISAEGRVLQLLKQLWVLPVDIRLSTHANQLRFRPRSYSYEGPLAFLDVVDKPIADWDAMMKRGFDIVLSALAALILSPLMIATAIAIRLESRGPILFRQKRYGFNNEVIDVLKFRSMYHEMADPDAKQVVTRNDPRVTRVGRFIRKTSIDELPQLFNVLRGDLSLVGPRPHAVNAHTHNKLWDEVVDGYFARHKVKPGVTGWAQINGWRGEVDDEEKIRQRVNFDLYYIENWSLLLDLYIVAITPFRILNSENAY